MSLLRFTGLCANIEENNVKVIYTLDLNCNGVVIGAVESSLDDMHNTIFSKSRLFG